MKKEKSTGNLSFILNSYLLFFVLIAFLVTCCMMLFVTVFASTLDVPLTDENISVAAKLTFGNVVLLSVIVTAIDAIRREFTVNRPVKRIIEAAEKIRQGDFHVRIRPINSFATDNKFN